MRLIIPYLRKVLDRCGNDITSLYHHWLIGDGCRLEKLPIGYNSINMIELTCIWLNPSQIIIPWSCFALSFDCHSELSYWSWVYFEFVIYPSILHTIHFMYWHPFGGASFYDEYTGATDYQHMLCWDPSYFRVCRGSILIVPLIISRLLIFLRLLWTCHRPHLDVRGRGFTDTNWL